MFKKFTKTKYTVCALLLFCLVSVVSIIPFINEGGVIGRSLDWSIPEESEHFEVMKEQSQYVWNDVYNEGFDMSNGQVSAWNSYLVGTLGTTLGLSGDTISKIVVFLATFAAAFFMYLATRYFLSRFGNQKNGFTFNIAAIVAGFIYGYSPIIFNQIVGGPITYYISYALLPLVCLLFVRSVSSEGKLNWSWVLAGGITYGAACIANQFAVFIFVSFILYIIIATKFRKKYTLSVLLIAGQAFLLNLYWLLPLFGNFGATVSNLYTLKTEDSLSALITNGIPFMEAINLFGFWNPYFINSLPPGLNIIWLLTTAAILILSISIVLVYKKNRFLWFCLITLFASLFFVKGGLEPFGSLNLTIYKYFTPFFLFRTLHHILVLPTFCLAILLAFWVNHKLHKSKTQSKNIAFLVVLIAVIGIVFVYSCPFLFGFLNNDLKTFSSNPELKGIVRELDQTNEDYRLTYFPMSNSPKFINPDDDSSLQGNDPNMSYSPIPVVIADIGVDNDSKRLARDAALATYNDYPTASQFFSLLNSRDFIWVKDRKPAHYSRQLSFFGQENYSELLHERLNNHFGEPLQDNDDLSHWQGKDTLPLIYPSNRIVKIDDNPNSLLYLLNFVDFEQYPNTTFLFAGENQESEIKPAVEIDSIYIDAFDETYISNMENWELGSRKVKSNKVDNEIEYEFHTSEKEDYNFDLAYSCDDKSISLNVNLDDNEIGIIDCTSDSLDHFNLYTFGNIKLPAGTHIIKIIEENKTKTRAGFNLYYLTFSDIKINDTVQDKTGSPPQISFEKNNPAHFRVEVSSATTPYYLNFLETFHPGWQATIGGIPLGTHQKVNGYANGWLVDKAGDYSIEIKYAPQRLYKKGIIISLTVLGSLVSLLIISLIIMGLRKSHVHAKN